MKIILTILYINIFFCYGYTQSLNNYQTDNRLKSSLDLVIHHWVSEILMDSLSMGMSFGISIKNENYFYNYGSIEKGEKKLPDQNTIYEIGSLTKTFTGILLAKAVIQGKINLDDDIRKYLDVNFDNLHYNGNPVKIIDLANHTSGLPEDLIPDKIFSLEDPTMFDIINVFDGDSGAIFRTLLQKANPDTLPGIRYCYSNAGMITLGLILENVYQLSYADLINKYISQPFGMSNTEIVSYKSDTSNYTKGYDKSRMIMPHITFQIAGAAGGLKSSTGDLIKYIERNIYKKDKAIELSQQESFNNGQHSMGLGWQLKPDFKNKVVLWHDGGEPGFSSYIIIIPDSKIGIVCLTNQRGRQYQFSQFCTAIIDSLCGQ
jgi:CubicO group peptidase (beta-lactamase class C family)